MHTRGRGYCFIATVEGRGRMCCESARCARVCFVISRLFEEIHHLVRVSGSRTAGYMQTGFKVGSETFNFTPLSDFESNFYSTSSPTLNSVSMKPKVRLSIQFQISQTSVCGSFRTAMVRVKMLQKFTFSRFSNVHLLAQKSSSSAQKFLANSIAELFREFANPS